MRIKFNKILIFTAVLFGAFFLLLFFSLFGTVNFNMREIFDILSGNATGARSVLYSQLRLPRVLVAFLIGAVLSIAGDSLQLTLKNPLADPYIVGISAGASFGAVLSLMMRETLGLSINMDLLAFIFALISAFTAYFISRKGGKVSVTSLILSGVIISFLFNAAVTFLVVFAWRNIISLHFWSLGSMSGVSWNDFYKMLVALFIESTIYIFFRRKMLILAAGEEHAVTVGVHPERVKTVIFFNVAFVSALSVSTAGLIGFVGLIIPHITRLLFGTDSKLNLFSTLLIGGVFLTACDTISRTLFQPTELPIGAVTALVGAPFFIYLLKRKAGIANG
ncbi:ABC transporter permease [Kosmotoga arenicorallina S304]|uniref:ABC transporter permease n=1 Tax=Kosmotoga arenicorallina S304 TaxID=1453497 RepID=A0A182C716_9BACT|nr:iron ABC transporter permease [Kosmotoga arenicorallina]OAA31261.1 ABC transporter permease [Kosmotoga arenicorallina S304]